MWLTRLSIQRPVFVIVLMTVFLVLGMRSRSEMRVDMNPSVDIPYVTVTTIYPGAGPEEVETLISKPLEDAVSGINGIKNISSTSLYSTSNVAIEFNLGTDVDVAAADVRQKVDAARQKLPNEAESPVIAKLDINAQPIFVIGISGKRSLRELRYLADTKIKYQLGQVAGVGAVDVRGGDVREIRVSVHRDRLQAYGLSITDITGAVAKANLNMPAGRITEGERDYDTRVLGEFQSVDEIRNVRVPVRTGGGTLINLRLQDVADVQDTIEDPSMLARIHYPEGGKVKGGNMVAITITKISDANTVEVIEGVKKELEQMQKDLPPDIKFITARDQSTQIEAALEDVNVSLILGALLAVIVIFLFLHNLRGTIICAIAIPTSLVAAFIPMHFMGFTLNQMSMLGLSLAVGILVDDSIVVLENIYRHLHRGERPREAAYNGRSEIGLAAVTITMVDVVVFLPIAFMGGIVGQFFRQFGVTVASATLFSLLVSFTVTPMLASRWYRVGEDVSNKRGLFKLLDDFLSKLDHAYRLLLGWALHHRWMVIVGGVAILLVTLRTEGKKLGMQFFPLVDQGQVQVNIETAPGTALERTDQIVQRVEAVTNNIPEVKTAFGLVGMVSNGLHGSESGRNYGQVSLMLYDKKGLLNAIGLEKSKDPLRARSDMEIVQEVRQKIADIPGAKFTVSASNSMGGSNPVQIELYGFDLDELSRAAEQVKARISKVPGIRDVDISLRDGKPELQAKLDRERASALGIDVTGVAAALRNSLDGNTDAKYREKGEEFNIRVQFDDQDRDKIDSLKQAIVANVAQQNGTMQPVYLQDVAQVDYGSGPTKIQRKNRMRQVIVGAALERGANIGNVQKQLEPILKQMNLGEIKMKWGGDAEMMAENFRYLFSAIFLAIILVYLLMAVLFDNLLHPFTIMLSLPMALVGAITGLVIAGKSMSIISMIGIIMLVGLVTKNAILLIDFTNTLRARGMERDAAIQEAGPTRLRPILMTTTAMILSMVPIALQIGRASEQRSPMADAVIGGLCVSAILTLVMIPVIYSLFDDAMNWLGRLLKRSTPQSANGAKLPAVSGNGNGNGKSHHLESISGDAEREPEGSAGRRDS